jgi:hypothetical protein
MMSIENTAFAAGVHDQWSRYQPRLDVYVPLIPHQQFSPSHSNVYTLTILEVFCSRQGPVYYEPLTLEQVRQ